MFRVLLFIKAKSWKQPRCLSTEEWAVVYSHNGMFLNNKNEQNHGGYRNMDEALRRLFKTTWYKALNLSE